MSSQAATLSNILRDPINHILTYDMRTANAHYMKRLQQKRAETRTKTLKYKMKRRKGKGKSKFKKFHCKAANFAKNIEKKIVDETPLKVTKPVQCDSGIDFTKQTKDVVKRKCNDDSFVPAPKRVKQVSLMNFFKK